MNRSPRVGRVLARGLLSALSLAAACSYDDEPAAPVTTAPPTTAAAVTATPSTEAPAVGTLDQVRLSVQEIAHVRDPVAFAAVPAPQSLHRRARTRVFSNRCCKRRGRKSDGGREERFIPHPSSLIPHP